MCDGSGYGPCFDRSPDLEPMGLCDPCLVDILDVMANDKPHVIALLHVRLRGEECPEFRRDFMSFVDMVQAKSGRVSHKARELYDGFHALLPN